MISKLTSNLLASFDGFYSAWKSTTKDDQNLSNLKLPMRTTERKILLQIQNDLTMESRVFYAGHGWSFNVGSCRGQSTSESYNPCRLISGIYPNQLVQNYLQNISRRGPFQYQGPMPGYPSSSSSSSSRRLQTLSRQLYQKAIIDLISHKTIINQI